jgi:hypothetical protein
MTPPQEGCPFLNRRNTAAPPHARQQNELLKRLLSRSLPPEAMNGDITGAAGDDVVVLVALGKIA